MRIPSGIAARDEKEYRRAYYAKYRDKLLAYGREHGAVWRAANRDYKRERARRVCAERKRAAFNILGGKCVRCGFADIRALQVDHIEQWPHSREERVKAGEMGEKLYRRILAGLANLSKYQLLCANCNWIKRHENDECRGKR